MNIEDKLPKAEDVYKESWNLRANGELDNEPAIIHAMHEYTKRVLDVVAEEAYADDVLDKFKRFKDLLK